MKKVWNFIRKIKRYINNINHEIEDPNDVLEYLEVLGEPVDMIERAYFQYLVVEKFHSRKYSAIRNIVWKILFEILKVYLKIQENKSYELKKCNVVYYKISNNQKIVPERYAYEKLQVVEMNEKLCTDQDVWSIIEELIKYKEYKFKFYILFSLSNYAYISKRYSPREIITTYESSFTSSVLTYYCRKKNIKHIDFMHGEKIISSVNTYAEYDVFYLWDIHYKTIFDNVKMKANQYVICNVWENVDLPKMNKTTDFTFYLNFETKCTLEKILMICNVLEKQGYRVKVRPHPSQKEDMFNRRPFVKYLENSEDVSIIDSIAQTRNCISRYSTVLFQAYSLGCNAIIDDLSNNDEFVKLRNAKYIMFYKKHQFLSEILDFN